MSNPGEAAQAKRRIAAVTLGHLPPPIAAAGLNENQQQLERLVDEYAQADGLDRRRRDRLAKLIVETASKTGLASEAGVAGTDVPDEALRRIDAWLCDLKDFAVKDGLHIYGRSPDGEADPLRLQSAEAERRALLDALDGKHIAAGPAGAPARGRTDVLPTGRNLFTADPRTMPTPTAYDLGKAAADEILRDYVQGHGDWPRALVIDSVGQRLAAHRRRGNCARPGADGLPARNGTPRPAASPASKCCRRRRLGARVSTSPSASPACSATCSRPRSRCSTPPPAPSQRATKPPAKIHLPKQLAQPARAPARIFGSSPGTYGAGVEDLLATR